jgi:mRNA-degrading endonuclease RelE of RelBE toxin-antitoxin system
MEVEEKIKRLPPNLQKEVMDFVDFLLEREERKPKRKPTLRWVGALKHLRDKYTSVELQHKILEWWIEDELDRH